MRGNPYLRLRRNTARALRRAIGGSLAVAVLSIAIATVAATTLESGDAQRLTQTAVPTTNTVGVAAGPPPTVATTDDLTPAAPLPDLIESIVPDLGLSPADVIEPVLESVAPVPATSSRVAAVQAVAPPPQLLTIEERREAAVSRAAQRGDERELIEPPFVVTEGQTGSPPLVAGDVIEATISFYYCEQGDTPDGGDGGGFCGAMRDGTIVYEGAAACALTYLGQQFRVIDDPTGRVYTCHDTGNAVHALHRDIFFHRAADGWPWLSSVGTLVVLEIVE